MSKPYWTWTCHCCEFDDNRNTDKVCRECAAKIRCEDAGGHYWDAGAEFCARGCGRRQDGTVELSERRQDY